MVAPLDADGYGVNTSTQKDCTMSDVSTFNPFVESGEPNRPMVPIIATVNVLARIAEQIRWVADDGVWLHTQPSFRYTPEGDSIGIIAEVGVGRHVDELDDFPSADDTAPDDQVVPVELTVRLDVTDRNRANLQEWVDHHRLNEPDRPMIEFTDFEFTVGGPGGGDPEAGRMLLLTADIDSAFPFTPGDPDPLAGRWEPLDSGDRFVDEMDFSTLGGRARMAVEASGRSVAVSEFGDDDDQ